MDLLRFSFNPVEPLLTTIKDPWNKALNKLEFGKVIFT